MRLPALKHELKAAEMIRHGQENTAIAHKLHHWTRALLLTREARELPEVISREIAELKSSLQRLNPVENEQEYNQAFASLVALETTRRGLHDLALRSI